MCLGASFRTTVNYNIHYYVLLGFHSGGDSYYVFSIAFSKFNPLLGGDNLKQLDEIKKNMLTCLLFDSFAHELDDGPHNEERIACLQRIKTMSTQ